MEDWESQFREQTKATAARYVQLETLREKYLIERAVCANLERRIAKLRVSYEDECYRSHRLRNELKQLQCDVHTRKSENLSLSARTAQLRKSAGSRVPQPTHSKSAGSRVPQPTHSKSAGSRVRQPTHSKSPKLSASRARRRADPRSPHHPTCTTPAPTLTAMLRKASAAYAASPTHSTPPSLTNGDAVETKSTVPSPGARTLPRLLRAFVTIGVGPRTVLDVRAKASSARRPSTWWVKPSILSSSPAKNIPKELSDLACFAFPDDVKVDRLDVTASSSHFNSVVFGQSQLRRGDNCFVVVLKNQLLTASTDQFGKDYLFCACVRTPQVRFLPSSRGSSVQVSAPVCYCLASRYPVFRLMFELLFTYLALQRVAKLQSMSEPSLSVKSPKSVGSGASPECASFLAKLFQLRKPSAGSSLMVQVPHGLPEVHLDTSIAGAFDLRTNVATWCCPYVFACLKARDLTVLLELVMREFSIVVVDPSPALLSAAVLSLLAIIAPLAWVSTVLTVVPRAFRAVIEAPVPFLVGLPQLSAGAKSLDDLPDPSTKAVWFVSAGQLWLPKSFSVHLPWASQLQQKLSPLLHHLSSSLTTSQSSKKRGILSGRSLARVPTRVRFAATPEDIVRTKDVLKICERSVRMIVDNADKNPGLTIMTTSQLCQHYLNRRHSPSVTL